MSSRRGDAQVFLRGTYGDTWELTVWLWGNSQAVVSGSTFATLDIGDSASATLNSATVEGFIRPNIHESSAAVFRGLGRGFLSSWNTTDDVEGQVPFILDITDCDIGGWGFIVGGSAEVEVVDSEFGGFLAYLSDTEGHIESIQPGYQDSWELDQFELSGGIPQVTLRNTSVDAWWGLMIDGTCHLTISDSLITLTLLHGSTSEISFVDSTVRMLFAHAASALFRFSNSRIREYMRLEDSFISFDEGVEVVQETEVGAWVGSVVFRTFEIVVVDETGCLLPGTRVVILDPAAVKVFEGATDENGQVTASILFASQTWDKEFTLILPDSDVSAALGFFASSDITIQLP
ncbi:hypothetical protein KAX17_08580 [Candidatus Bipolaricaulota bacterium]|nr:hypothetical protein [Candidatus Bipolaricaulota bacterium]